MQIPSREARPILRGDCLHSRRRVNIAAREANEARVRVSSGRFVSQSSCWVVRAAVPFLAAVLESELGLLFLSQSWGCCSGAAAVRLRYLLLGLFRCVGFTVF